MYNMIDWAKNSVIFWIGLKPSCNAWVSIKLWSNIFYQHDVWTASATHPHFYYITCFFISKKSSIVDFLAEEMEQLSSFAVNAIGRLSSECSRGGGVIYASYA